MNCLCFKQTINKKGEHYEHKCIIYIICDNYCNHSASDRYKFGEQHHILAPAVACSWCIWSKHQQFLLLQQSKKFLLNTKKRTKFILCSFLFTIRLYALEVFQIPFDFSSLRCQIVIRYDLSYISIYPYQHLTMVSMVCMHHIHNL